MHPPGGLAGTATWLRAVVAVVMGAHGLVHLMGVALAWRLAEPGELTYADLSVEPGSAAGLGLGGVWLAACLGLAGAAVLLLLRRDAWWWTAAGGVGLSLVVTLLEVRTAPVGLAVSLLLAVLLLVDRLRWRRA